MHKSREAESCRNLGCSMRRKGKDSTDEAEAAGREAHPEAGPLCTVVQVSTILREDSP